MAQQYVDETAWRVIRQRPGWPSLRVLELGCGDGALIERMLAEGVTSVEGTTFRTKDADYIREHAHATEVEPLVHTGIDLNQPLPMPSEAYDLVVSIEVIEHVEGHRNFISQTARVLRPGGWLVLTTPNVARLGSRLRFFWTGQMQTKREPMPGDLPLARMEEYHHRCVDFPTLHWLMWRSGLRIDSLAVTKAKAVSRLLSVSRPAIAAATRRVALRRATSEEDRASKLDLARWLSSRAVLTSEQLCIVARKEEAGDVC